MKKLLFAVFMLIAAGTMAQSIPAKTTICDSVVLTADTSFQFQVRANYTWHILIAWEANDGTTATVKIQQSIDGTNWHDYSGLSAYTITGATGSVAFEDEYLSGNYMKIVFTAQAGKTCTLSAWHQLKYR